MKNLLREIFDKHALSQQSAQLTRSRVYNDSRFYKEKPPPKNTPKWACKQSNKVNRPLNDYDTSLNYGTDEEHQHGESSTTGMIRNVIQEADARFQRDNALEDDVPAYYTDDDGEDDYDE